MAKSAPKFENRVRFNWGFHDACQAITEGWDNESKNYGFGPALKIKKPEDVVEQHFDREFAIGWLYGYYEKLGGISPCETSEHAWNDALKNGQVSA